jgi:hypothetical protein
MNSGPTAFLIVTQHSVDLGKVVVGQFPTERL